MGDDVITDEDINIIENIIADNLFEPIDDVENTIEQHFSDKDVSVRVDDRTDTHGYISTWMIPQSCSNTSNAIVIDVKVLSFDPTRQNVDQLLQEGPDTIFDSCIEGSSIE